MISTDFGTNKQENFIAKKICLNNVSTILEVTNEGAKSNIRAAPYGPNEMQQMKAVYKVNRIQAMAMPVAAAFRSRLVEDAAVPFQQQLQATDLTG
mgnify:CR=1 FL=1